MKDGKVQHTIGQVIEVDSVVRLRGKKFKVKHGSSCTMCDFTGLGHVLCPKSGLDGAHDILVEGDSIKSIAPRGKLKVKADEVFDAKGMHVLPGLVDLHVHLELTIGLGH